MDQAVNEQVNELIAMLTAMLNGDEQAIQNFDAAPVDYIDAQASDVAAEDLDPVAMLEQALAGSELDADQQAAVMDAVHGAVNEYPPADGGAYSSEQLAQIFAQGINVTIEEGDHISVDNSLYVDGDVKGGIHQANQTDLTQADDGAIIADGAHGSNFQTGEGNVQLTGVDADNITTGDGNTVASAGSTIGNENVDAYEIHDAEFGYGDKDDSEKLDVEVTDSLNSEYNEKIDYTDDDVYKTDVDIDVKEEGYGYEPVKEVEPDYHDDHGHDHDEPYDG